MCKNWEGFFCRSAAFVVAAASGTSINYVASHFDCNEAYAKDVSAQQSSFRRLASLKIFHNEIQVHSKWLRTPNFTKFALLAKTSS